MKNRKTNWKKVKKKNVMTLEIANRVMKEKGIKMRSKERLNSKEHRIFLRDRYRIRKSRSVRKIQGFVSG